MIANVEEITATELKKQLLLDAINTLVVVATDTELDAAKDSMHPLPGYDGLLINFQNDQTYYIGVIGSYPVALVMVTMMGSLKRDASFATVSEAISHWAPKMVIMEGIAFGRDNERQQIGDILICETLSQYETTKQRPNGEIITRGHSVPSSSILLNRFSQESRWFNKTIKSNVAIRKCEILSGEKLIDDKVIRNTLFERFSNAQGGEMEGNGLYAACSKGKVEWIICKAICDWADGNKDDQWQHLAASNAAQYVAYILRNKTAFESIGVYSVDSQEIYGILYKEEPSYHDIRGKEIIKIIYPKHEISDSITVSIPKDGIYYQFVKVVVTEHITLGYVFFAKKINQDRTIQHFLSKYDGKCDSLVVCSPRIKSKVSGKDDYRLSNLEGEIFRTQ